MLAQLRVQIILSSMELKLLENERLKERTNVVIAVAIAQIAVANAHVAEAKVRIEIAKTEAVEAQLRRMKMEQRSELWTTWRKVKNELTGFLTLYRIVSHSLIIHYHDIG